MKRDSPETEMISVGYTKVTLHESISTCADSLESGIPLASPWLKSARLLIVFSKDSFPRTSFAITSVQPPLFPSGALFEEFPLCPFIRVVVPVLVITIRALVSRVRGIVRKVILLAARHIAEPSPLLWLSRHRRPGTPSI